ncbi:hypothetical protein T265_15321, partial [Opisthorchis viverrini]
RSRCVSWQANEQQRSGTQQTVSRTGEHPLSHPPSLEGDIFQTATGSKYQFDTAIECSAPGRLMFQLLRYSRYRDTCIDVIIRTESTGFFTLSRVKLTICKCVPQSTRNLNMKITEAHLDTIESFDSVRKIDRIFVQTASTTWTDDNHTTYPDFQQTIHTTHTWNQVEFMDDTNDVLEWSAFCSSC